MEWLLQIVLLATQLNAKIVIKGSMLIKTSALPASPTAGCALLLNAVFVMKATILTPKIIQAVIFAIRACSDAINAQKAQSARSVNNHILFPCSTTNAIYAMTNLATAFSARKLHVSNAIKVSTLRMENVHHVTPNLGTANHVMDLGARVACPLLTWVLKESVWNVRRNSQNARTVQYNSAMNVLRIIN